MTFPNAYIGNPGERVQGGSPTETLGDDKGIVFVSALDKSIGIRYRYRYRNRIIHEFTPLDKLISKYKS